MRVILIFMIFVLSVSLAYALECGDVCISSVCAVSCPDAYPDHASEADFPSGCAELTPKCCCAVEIPEEFDEEENGTSDDVADEPEDSSGESSGSSGSSSGSSGGSGGGSGSSGSGSGYVPPSQPVEQEVETYVSAPSRDQYVEAEPLEPKPVFDSLFDLVGFTSKDNPEESSPFAVHLLVVMFLVISLIVSATILHFRDSNSVKEKVVKHNAKVAVSAMKETELDKVVKDAEKIFEKESKVKK